MTLLLGRDVAVRVIPSMHGSTRNCWRDVAVQSRRAIARYVQLIAAHLPSAEYCEVDVPHQLQTKITAQEPAPHTNVAHNSCQRTNKTRLAIQTSCTTLHLSTWH